MRQVLRGPGIQDEILEVLKACTVEGNVVRIAGQLDRPTYEAVNKILSGIGGKWDRKAKGHVFEHGDAEDLLAGVIMSGQLRDIRKELQFFPTPEAVADRLVAWADIEPGMVVLEPSAGRGHLARRLRNVKSPVIVLEKHDPYRESCAPAGSSASSTTRIS
jgi:hypothetical protein